MSPVGVFVLTELFKLQDTHTYLTTQPLQLLLDPEQSYTPRPGLSPCIRPVFVFSVSSELWTLSSPRQHELFSSYTQKKQR